MGAVILKCRSSKSVRSHDAVLAALARARYSALDDDRITIGCFFKYHVIGDLPNLNMKPAVDLKTEGDA